MATYRIGIDVGGTFTDLVAVDESGVAVLAKSASTPDDPSIGVMDGLDELAKVLKLDRATLLARTQRIVHGTTVATNALLERKGAKVGLLTTEGHRDLIEMREGLKEDRYNLRMTAPEPLVPRYLRLGVRERMRADGEVHTPLDHRSLDAAIAALKQEGVTAVAIAYLHAWRNAAHEQATVAAVRKAMPRAFVTASSEVYPQIKEYERISTTIVNAYVGPIVETYLARLDERLKAAGFEEQLFIILSHGGVAPVAEAVRLAAATVLSGPAGGVAGSRYAAQLLGVANLIPFDMGGTSTDISLIRKSAPAVSIERGIAGQRIALPSLDIVTLGAGGGSIARVDAGGVLHVGPESAGASPGPACYGRGGSEPTVTDANVVLGYLDPAQFLGGRMTLDPKASAAALDRLAGQLRLDREAAAAGVFRVINGRMAEGIRLVSVRRGVDPTGFALLAFGGAAGLHVTSVARLLSMHRVVVPRVAAVLSAWGMLATDIRYELTRSHIGDASAMQADALRKVFQSMEKEGRARLAATFDGPVEAHASADMRYGEQIFEINVPLDGIDWKSRSLVADIAERFHRRHEELYTYALRGQDVVLVNARQAVIGKLPSPPREPEIAAGRAPEPVRRQRVHLGSWREVPVYKFEALARDAGLEGPALVESDTTTVLLQAGDTARVTAHGWLDIAVD
jgi:N-methylhydantoinase A